MAVPAVPGASLPSSFVHSCMEAEQLGDGMLFAEMQRGKFTFNKSTGEWMRWQGHTWEPDVMNYAHAAVEELALRYGQEMAAFDKQIAKAVKNGQEDLKKQLLDVKKKYAENVRKLRRTNGRNACLEFAHTCPGKPLAVTEDQMDQDPWLLGFPNGVMDLRTGLFRDGMPEDNISKRVGVEWQGHDVECPTWDKFLKESLPTEEEAEYLEVFMGYCLTGVVDEHRMLHLIGEGRNGKSIFVEILMELLGDYARPGQAEMLMDQGRARSSAGPSPDVMAMKGVRAMVFSEIDEGRKMSLAAVKLITGGDKRTGRLPHDKRETTFAPSAKPILVTNTDMYMPADDFALKQRLDRIEFPFKFVKDPKGPNEKLRIGNLKELLIAEKPGIMAKIVKKCFKFQRDGLVRTRSMEEWLSAVLRDNDLVQDFIEALCYVPDDPTEVVTPATDLYLSFKDWYKEFHRDKAPTIHWFGRRMAKKFKKYKAGVVVYEGVGLLAQ